MKQNDRVVLDKVQELVDAAKELGIEVDIKEMCFALELEGGELITAHNNLDHLQAVLKGIKWEREHSKVPS